MELYDYWSSGRGGRKLLKKSTAPASTTRFAPGQKLGYEWKTGMYDVKMSLTLQELTKQIKPGQYVRIHAEATATVTSKGMGFDKTAFVELRAGRTAEDSIEKAQNRAVALRVNVGPTDVTPSYQLQIMAIAGLGSVNDHRYRLIVKAIYKNQASR